MHSSTFSFNAATVLRALALFAAILSMLTVPQVLAEPGDDAAALQLARSYFQHLDHERFDAARELMADSIVFEDPTWGGTPITDPDEVIELYSNSAGFTNVVLDERMAFVSNGSAVFHYVASLDILPTADSAVKTPVPAMTDLVRMATVKDGKIVRHIDLAAYTKLREALARAAEAQNDE